MGLVKGVGKLFRPITTVVNRANEVIENLEDQVDHWRDVAAREHDLRVEGLANAKIAMADADYHTAVIEGRSRAAAAEAEARGVARGTVEGYQRALDETEIFDAGFEGGRRRRDSMPSAQRSTHVFGSQARTQGPPPSVGNKKYMTERGSTSTRAHSRTGGSSIPQGGKQFKSECSGRSRHIPPTEPSGNQPSNHGPESKAASSNRSTHRTDEKTNIPNQEYRLRDSESRVDPSNKAATSTGKDQAKEQSGNSTTASGPNTGDGRAKLPATKGSRSGTNSNAASKRTVGGSRVELPATKGIGSGVSSTTESKRSVGDNRAELHAKKSCRSSNDIAAPSHSIASSQSTVRPYNRSTVHPGSSVSQVKARPDAPSTVHPSSSASRSTSPTAKPDSSISTSQRTAKPDSSSKVTLAKPTSRSKAPTDKGSTVPSTQLTSPPKAEADTRSTVPSSNPTSHSTMTKSTSRSTTQPKIGSKITSSQSASFSTPRAGVHNSVPSPFAAAKSNGESSNRSTIISDTSQPLARRISQMRRRDRPFYEDDE